MPGILIAKKIPYQNPYTRINMGQYIENILNISWTSQKQFCEL